MRTHGNLYSHAFIYSSFIFQTNIDWESVTKRERVTDNTGKVPVPTELTLRVTKDGARCHGDRLLRDLVQSGVGEACGGRHLQKTEG